MSNGLLNLSVLATKIPVACVGVPQIRAMPIKFSTRALARSRGWDAWLPWQELPLPNPRIGTGPKSFVESGWWSCKWSGVDVVGGIVCSGVWRMYLRWDLC